MADPIAVHLCLMHPPGTAHSQAVADAIAQFRFRFEALGRTVSTEPNRLRHDAINFVFEPRRCAQASLYEQHLAIAVDLAATSRQREPGVLPGGCLEVSDDPDQAARISLGVHAMPILVHGPLPGRPGPAAAPPLSDRPLDILLLGTVSPRQTALLTRLEAQGRSVAVAPDTLPADRRDALVRQARVVLLLAASDSGSVAWQHAATSLTLGTPVLCEMAAPSALPAYLDGCVNGYPAGLIEEGLNHALASLSFAGRARRQIERFWQIDVGSCYADMLAAATSRWPAHRAAQATRPATDTAISWAAARTRHVEVDARPQAPRGAAPLFQHMDGPARQAEQLIAAGRYEDALQTIAGTVHQHYCLPDVKHQALYYPQLDQMIERLSKLVDAGSAPAAEQFSDVTLIVATEVYQIGGHTRVIEDIARAVKRPVIVLTDLFGNYKAEDDKLQWIRDKFSGIHVVCLPAVGMWDKSQALRRIVAHLNVDNIVYVQHHQDPIPFVATLSHPASRKTFVHHGDHNPSLGCTLKGLQHADLSDLLQQTCTQHLGHQTTLLPMHVADRGVRRSGAPDGRALSVATCGHPAKYSKSGELALHRIVATVLQAVPGSFYHIGMLDEAWITQIREHLAAAGVAPGRFVPLGAVASLWDTLLALDVGFYLGSAPVGGGRSAIEAQGAALPLIFYKGEHTGSLLQNYTLYAHQELGWTTLDDLSSRLRTYAPQHKELGQRARAFYEENFSARRFRSVLGELVSEAALLPITA
ncbi:hypothetical protein V4F39_19520 [Aquincola sp. MAHUQ-54]|uniref:Glycosyltransferase n=1 Tax=Aquincola agrisoli TaxID=3119538 RepID=A0AAW9QJ20_9BURK